MSHIKHYVSTPGYTVILKPGDGELDHLTFGILHLGAGQNLTFAPEAGHEMALTFLTGSVDAASMDQRWHALGGRTNVFERATDTLFIPPGSSIDLHALTDCEIAAAQAASHHVGPITLYSAASAMIEHRGKPGWRREVRTYLHSSANVGRLILGEVASSAGEWSSFPPHKHDIDSLPIEADLEEIYFFQIEPKTGFAFQGLYDLDDPASDHRAYIVRHHDVVAIPRGYHPVAVAPGHRIYYYWVLAGKGHNLKVHVEDSLRWVEPEFTIK